MLLSKAWRVKRNRHRFVPGISDGLNGVELERRFLAAVVFQRSPDFNQNLTLTSGADANTQGQLVFNGPFVGGQAGAGTFDSTFQAQASSNASTAGVLVDGNGTVIASGTNTANVTAEFTGPGSGQANDPNPVSSAEIQITSQHTAKDQFINNTANPLNDGNWAGVTFTGSATKPANPGYTFVVAGAPAGGATITETFTATASVTNPNGNLYDYDAKLTLNSTYLNVFITHGGASATDGAGNGIKGDITFENFNDTLSHTFTVTQTVKNVPNGTAFKVGYSDSLDTEISQFQNFPVGTTTNNSTFNWSLTVNIS